MANSKRRAAQKRTLLKRDGAVCTWCGRITAPEDLTLDHIVPKSRGGRDHLRNLTLACVPCNQAKANLKAHDPSWRKATA